MCKVRMAHRVRTALVGHSVRLRSSRQAGTAWQVSGGGRFFRSPSLVAGAGCRIVGPKRKRCDRPPRPQSVAGRPFRLHACTGARSGGFIFLLTFCVIDIEDIVPPLPDNRPAFTAGERVLIIIQNHMRMTTSTSIHDYTIHFYTMAIVSTKHMRRSLHAAAEADPTDR